MISRIYKVMQIDGDYAHLLDVEAPNSDWKLVARALLPAEIFEGCMLKYEMLEYEMIDN
ncbi:MAG: chorismate--pyruvate lyase [Lachnospiraceae bacterium]|nr:chorismate--pyruvate lyase [Lachnospiraceae bacterium]